MCICGGSRGQIFLFLFCNYSISLYYSPHADPIQKSLEFLILFTLFLFPPYFLCHIMSFISEEYCLSCQLSNYSTSLITAMLSNCLLCMSPLVDCEVFKGRVYVLLILFFPQCSAQHCAHISCD